MSCATAVLVFAFYPLCLCPRFYFGCLAARCLGACNSTRLSAPAKELCPALLALAPSITGLSMHLHPWKKEGDQRAKNKDKDQRERQVEYGDNETCEPDDIEPEPGQSQH